MRQANIPTGSIEQEVSNPLYSIPLLLLAIVVYYYRQLITLVQNFSLHKNILLNFLNKRNSQAIISENGTKKKNKSKKLIRQNENER